MTYQEALSYLYSFFDLEKLAHPYPKYFNLENMYKLLELLDNPHQNLKAIHIAGTKGKGSTSAIISSILTASGKTTGLYTSPHLFRLEERIRINGKPIPQQELAEIVEVLRSTLEGKANKGFRTFFEILTSLAFLYFQKKKVDLAVIETGLGGRLDATNVLYPKVAVITSISFDHTHILGNTLSQIAKEKAGIIKPGSIVVISPQMPEALKVLHQACLKKGVELIKVGKDITWEVIESNLKGQELKVFGLKGSYRFFLPLAGEFQQENAATAIAAIEALGELIDSQTINLGLTRLSWIGRFQLLREEPMVIVDGAHNAYSARRLRESLTKLVNYRKLILIMGSSIDKDIPGMVEELALLNPIVIATSSEHPKAASPKLIARCWEKRGIYPMVTEDSTSAFQLALNLAEEQDLILVTGSLFLVAEIIEQVCPEKTGF